MIIKQCQFAGRDGQGEHVHLIHPGYSNHELIKSADVIPEQLRMINTFFETYKKRPNCTYPLLTALGASEYWGDNSNSDRFPEASLIHKPHNWDSLSYTDQIRRGKSWEWGFPTFYNAFPYAHHQNGDPKRAYGSIIYALWDDRMKRVLLVIEVDHAKCKQFGAMDILDRILNGEFIDVSMGTRVFADFCSVCTEWDRVLGIHPKQILASHEKKAVRGLAITKEQYCQHIKFELGRILPNGIRVAMVNLHPRFFDLSFVYIGADKTSKVLAKLAGKCPIRADAPMCKSGCFDGCIPSTHIHEVWERSKMAYEIHSPNLEEVEDVFDRVASPRARLVKDQGEKLVGLSRNVIRKLRGQVVGQEKRSATFPGLDQALAEERDKVSSWVRNPLITSIGGSVLGGGLGYLVAPEDKKIQGAILGSSIGGGIGSGASSAMRRHAKLENKLLGTARSVKRSALTSAETLAKQRAQLLRNPRISFPGMSADERAIAVKGAEIRAGHATKRLQEAISAPVAEVTNRDLLTPAVIGGIGGGGMGAAMALPFIMEGGESDEQRSGRKKGKAKMSSVINTAMDLAFSKAAQDKRADQDKMSEIIKQIRSGFANNLSSITDQEPDLDDDMIKEIAKDVPNGLSSAGSLGVVLKPREFQKTILIAKGKPDLANELSDQNICFTPQMDRPSSLQMGKEIIPRILEMIAPLIGARSSLAPALHHRVIRISIKGPCKDSCQSLENPILDKLSCDYAAYRRHLLSSMEKLAMNAMEYYPSALTYLFPDSDNRFGIGLVKEGEGVVQFFGMLPTEYLNRAYLSTPVISCMDHQTV